ncbi:TetR/AcrR family transcriptional regulator [Faecalibaculum rodentium]|uniref:TetR/AcrR family transcriptional regulator n=1 Tax=Faecalibaculum rodentium TaxID=1702221 RepID=UPI00256ED7D8|nr:TetR/AcrR family transcriptional regulator [Faecalibaculum rodentium]
MSQTRTAIQQAFLQLARENPADKITVTDIVTRAGINRNSFYYYFEDLPGMIEITVQELFERTILQNRPQTFQECVDVLADIMSQNRSACMHLFRSRSRIDLQLYYHRVCGCGQDIPGVRGVSGKVSYPRAEGSHCAVLQVSAAGADDRMDGWWYERGCEEKLRFHAESG